MTDEQATASARAFLKARAIPFEEPARTGASANAIEVVFHAPGALNSKLVVDPRDVRVLVSLSDGACMLVEQM